MLHIGQHRRAFRGAGRRQRQRDIVGRVDLRQVSKLAEWTEPRRGPVKRVGEIG